MLGLAAVAAYFYVTVFARLRAVRSASRRRAATAAAVPAFTGLSLFLSAALLGAAAVCWLVPTEGRLLNFAPAEVQFLFPAPVRRRDLLIHRLLRSQVGLLFASIVPAIAFALPSGSAETAVRTAIALWAVLVAASVYFSAVALARSRMMSSDARLRRLARLPLVVVLAGALAVASALARDYFRRPFTGPDEALARMTAVWTTGVPRLVLTPFALLVQPFFANSWTSFAIAMAGALGVGVLAMIWLLASDAAFQGATDEGAERQEAQASGGAKSAYRLRQTDWTLAPTGRPEVAFVWKSTMQMLRVVDRRVAMRFIVIVLSLSFLIVAMNRSAGLAALCGWFALGGAVYCVLLAPQILRLDLRQDLRHLELLKTWPVNAAAVVRGEIMGPALVLSAGSVALVALALMFSSTMAITGVNGVWRVSLAIAAAFMGPALIFGQYMVHNGVALLFPAWVPLGSQRPRGLEAMGQRLLTLGGTWLALALMVLPGAIVGAVLWFAFYRFVGPPIVAIAAVVCAGAMALEILMLSEAFGPAYERLDLLAVERQD